MEFRSAKEWNNHITQHFKQRKCRDCGETLIRVGNVWYSPHSSHSCYSNNFQTESVVEAQQTEEVILPDFIEVKAEEIYDVVEESEDDNDIFEETTEISNDGPASPDEAQPYSMKQLKKDISSNTSKEIPNVVTSLTEDQLQKRACPICHKVIVNKQNLICHINIHNGVKPFVSDLYRYFFQMSVNLPFYFYRFLLFQQVCVVCEKAFAHIRNLVRHKEQQRHFETEFKCQAKGCKKVFMSSNKLSRHLKIAHSAYNEPNSVDKPFVCAHCGRGFFTSGFLRMHLRLCHSE